MTGAPHERGPEPVAGTLAADWATLNRANWDDRVPIHVRSQFYDVDGFVQGDEHLYPFEVEDLGDLTGKRVVHLQCHIGLDTISLGRHGAEVTGLDFSAPALAEAAKLARKCGVSARFVEANVYDAIAALGGERFDVVYPGRGALNWLPDLDAWARVVAGLLVPGGRLYLTEFHPILNLFNSDLELKHPYFNEGAEVWDAPFTYTEGEVPLEHTILVEWPHPLSDVINAIVGAGLRIERLDEHDYCAFAAFPSMVQLGPRLYRLPEDMPRLPFMFTITATRPS